MEREPLDTVADRLIDWIGSNVRPLELGEKNQILAIVGQLRPTDVEEVYAQLDELTDSIGFLSVGQKQLLRQVVDLGYAVGYYVCSKAVNPRVKS